MNPEETKTEKKQRTEEILEILSELFPDSKCHLNFENALELLIGTILSAQCTDERVNQVTPALFKKYPESADYAGADPETLKQEIYSTGFFQNKAKSIIACNRAIIEKHDGKIPRTIEELTALPGLGRKSANVLLGNVFGAPAIVVDTHIKRISNRLGLTDKTDPVKIEFELQDLLPSEEWTMFSHRAGDLGRQICKSRKPLCHKCPLQQLCPSALIFD